MLHFPLCLFSGYSGWGRVEFCEGKIYWVRWICSKNYVSRFTHRRRNQSRCLLWVMDGCWVWYKQKLCYGSCRRYNLSSSPEVVVPVTEGGGLWFDVVRADNVQGVVSGQALAFGTWACVGRLSPLLSIDSGTSCSRGDGRRLVWITCPMMWYSCHSAHVRALTVAFIRRVAQLHGARRRPWRSYWRYGPLGLRPDAQRQQWYRRLRQRLLGTSAMYSVVTTSRPRLRSRYVRHLGKLHMYHSSRY